MTGNLLDTNVVLITLTRPAKLSARMRKAIIAGPNFLSAVVYWEVLLKVMKGALIVGEPRSWWLDALDLLAATPLAIQPEHVARVYGLSPIHNDPFDRILIAQASVEDMILITTDKEIPRYASAHFRVLS